ncbi:uncharacterized protein L969DRAFT_82842 [Mixia osmundae IAM 14324]|uniref:DUF7918 domain-containing protein n=1 Tax=Mixia osmundae (strain CBS 9802 / IAM 14324 / JCM 22182 / KY 12970) TaxID=764103 RepID=G7DSG8_MIXOS|nr:uncharacterized protein L969DRAFT_82842 [Mixia osmundae IAM 14324]KEI37977.1 hypothetical protein L969DRAFT_82842 [Mixia osmundae IAM 14324]GAA93528.1 hypothetical protein E5Q_00169 [Mixia osmundae IAM 14324]
MLHPAGVEAWLLVDGQRAEEYAVEQQGSKMECIIESKPGSRFSVHFLARAGSDATRFATTYQLSIDGSPLKHRLHLRLGRAPRECGWKGYDVDRTTTKAFTFARIETSDDPVETMQDHTLLEGLGKLVITGKRGVSQKSAVQQNQVYETDRVAPVIDEKMKKGQLLHQTKAGADLSPRKACETWTMTQTYDTDEAPFVSLTFRYVSREALELEGLVDMPEPEQEPDAKPVRSKVRPTGKVIVIEDDEPPRKRDMAKIESDELTLLPAPTKMIKTEAKPILLD